MLGLVHIYTGNGKGKTTAALGLGIRACGRGFKVLMVQFLKGRQTGEMESLKKLEPDFILYRSEELKKFTWTMTPEELEEAKSMQQCVFDYAMKAVAQNKVDLLIMDEIMATITTGMIPLQSVIDFIKGKPKHMEIVLTGRNAPAELVELADYVSEINEIKHPMTKGIPARVGIES